MQEPDQRIGDARVVDEFGDSIEHRPIVVVEAEDHTAQHIDAVLLYAPDALEQGARIRPHILYLLGFQKRLLVRAFNADKYALEIGKAHQLHEFLVLGRSLRPR